MGHGHPRPGAGCRPENRALISTCARAGHSMGLYFESRGAHNHPVNRAWHRIAIPARLRLHRVASYHWILGLALIPAAFALPWIGRWIAANRPAFLTNPVERLGTPVGMTGKIFGVGEKESFGDPFPSNRSVGWPDPLDPHQPPLSMPVPALLGSDSQGNFSAPQPRALIKRFPAAIAVVRTRARSPTS
jgi:hypothetical protein